MSSQILQTIVKALVTISFYVHPWTLRQALAKQSSIVRQSLTVSTYRNHIITHYSMYLNILLPGKSRI